MNYKTVYEEELKNGKIIIFKTEARTPFGELRSYYMGKVKVKKNNKNHQTDCDEEKWYLSTYLEEVKIGLMEIYRELIIKNKKGVKYGF